MKALWWYLPLEVLATVFVQHAIGLDLAHAVLVLVVAAAVTIMLVAQPSIHAPQWPREPVDRRDGARDRISALSWAFMTRDERVSVRGLQAVRDAATVRLALHGVDLDDPAHADAARELLGTGPYTILTAQGPPPSMDQLGRCIDRLAAIEPAPLTHPSPSALPQPSPRTS